MVMEKFPFCEATRSLGEIYECQIIAAEDADRRMKETEPLTLTGAGK